MKMKKLSVRVLITCAAIIVGFFAFFGVYSIGKEVYNRYVRHYFCCDDPYCYENTFISRDIFFHNHYDGRGYIYNICTGEKFIKNVTWIAKPCGKDSLVCFSKGGKRGYFSKNTGKVVIEPKYDHAWIFSDGLASVEKGGYIKFIDATGKVVIDKKMPYIPNMQGYVFHGGYCVVDTDDGEQCGLMDKKGNIVLPLEYSAIRPSNDFVMWRVQKGKEMAVLNKDLKPVVPFMECSIYIGEGTIDATMPDHTMRKYDMQGTLINDFYVSGVRMLEYEKEEVVCRKNKEMGVDDDMTEEMEECSHPKATARLRAYVAGDGYEGLMTSDGHVVMMPQYKDIEAIGYDLYLCTSTNDDKVIVNGKGEIVK